MFHSLNKALTLCAVLALCACAEIQPHGEPVRITSFLCGERPVSLQFDAKNAAELTMGGHVFALKSIPTDSGEKFEAVTLKPHIAFWTKDNEAKLEIDEKPYPDCKVVPLERPEAFKEYRAIGNEPAWFLSVTDHKILFNKNFGQKIVTAEITTPQETAQGHLYTIKTGEQDMTIKVERKVCLDTVSGLSYPDQVTISFLGETMKGCGNPLSAEDMKAPAPETEKKATTITPTSSSATPAPALVALPEIKAGQAYTKKPWRAKEIDGHTVMNDTQIHLVFGEDGHFTGYTGCNDLIGSYRAKDTTLNISNQMIQSDNLCAADVLKQEKAFTTLLKSSSLIDLRNDTLIISTSNRKTIVFVEEPVAAPLRIAP